MTEVKVCGITNPEDALHAVECGADALGFIFHPGSPRFVAPQRALDIIKALPRGVVKVGVFVNRDIREVKETAELCGLDLIQLHGDEPPEYCRHFAPEVLIKAVFPDEGIDPEGLNLYPVKAFLADRRTPGRHGGTGEKADWKAARTIGAAVPLILAGGLNPENIAAAIEAVSPPAVDVNSGVEAYPGKKDPEKVKAVIAVAHAVERKEKRGIFGKGCDKL